MNECVHAFLTKGLYLDFKGVSLVFQICTYGAWGESLHEANYVVLTTETRDEHFRWIKLWKENKESLRELGFNVVYVGSGFEIRYTGSLETEGLDLEGVRLKCLEITTPRQSFSGYDYLANKPSRPHASVMHFV